MMAPVVEDSDGNQRYVLADSREEVQKAEDILHKNVNDKLKLIKQAETSRCSRQQEYDRLFNGTNARSSHEGGETPTATIGTLAPAKKITRRSLVGRVRPTPVTTGARSSSDADPHGTVTSEEAAEQTANAASSAEATSQRDTQYEPPSPVSVSSSTRRDIYFGDAQQSSSRLPNMGNQRTQGHHRPDTGYQYGYEHMPTYAHYQHQTELAQVSAQMGGDINEAQRQIVATAAAANDFKMYLSATIAQQSLQQSHQLKEANEARLQLQKDLEQQFEEFCIDNRVKRKALHKLQKAVEKRGEVIATLMSNQRMQRTMRLIIECWRTQSWGPEKKNIISHNAARIAEEKPSPAKDKKSGLMKSLTKIYPPANYMLAPGRVRVCEICLAKNIPFYCRCPSTSTIPGDNPTGGQSSKQKIPNPAYHSVGTEVLQSDAVRTRGRSSTDDAPENKEADPVAEPESNPVYRGVGTEVHQSDATCTGGGSGGATSVVEEIKSNAAYPDYSGQGTDGTRYNGVGQVPKVPKDLTCEHCGLHPWTREIPQCDKCGKRVCQDCRDEGGECLCPYLKLGKNLDGWGTMPACRHCGELTRKPPCSDCRSRLCRECKRGMWKHICDNTYGTPYESNCDSSSDGANCKICGLDMGSECVCTADEMDGWLQQQEQQQSASQRLTDNAVAASSAATSHDDSLAQQKDEGYDKALEDQYYRCKLCHYVNDTNSDQEWAQLSPRDRKRSAEA